MVKVIQNSEFLLGLIEMIDIFGPVMNFLAIHYEGIYLRLTPLCLICVQIQNGLNSPDFSRFQLQRGCQNRVMIYSFVVFTCRKGSPISASLFSGNGLNGLFWVCS